MLSPHARGEGRWVSRASLRPGPPAELSEIAKKRDLPGRSKMGRDELARKLGES